MMFLTCACSSNEHVHVVLCVHGQYTCVHVLDIVPTSVQHMCIPHKDVCMCVVGYCYSVIMLGVCVCV